MRAERFENTDTVRMYSFVIFFILLAHASAQSECGDFYDIEPNIVGNIYSPNWPDMYPPNSFCIWLIAVQPHYRIQLVLNYTGESYNNTCSDYIEVRNSSKYGEILEKVCDNGTQTVITSLSQRMWIKFVSDRINTTGMPMNATFSVFWNQSTPVNTFQECRSYEFVCRNKECVSMSYRCDGMNDCGCLVDCDESMCSGLDISKELQVLISIITGVVVFAIMCLITYCIEGKNNWIASQAEALREKEIVAEKQRQRASRAFSKFIGTEKDILLSLPKSKLNLSGHRLTSSMSIR